MDKDMIYSGLVIGGCLAVLLAREFRPMTPKRLMTKRTDSRGSSPQTSIRRPQRDASRTDARLEAAFRSAILSSHARESLLQDALRKTNGDRTAAIRKVLDDLHMENNRWS